MGELVHGLHSLASKGIQGGDVRPMGCPGPGLARAPSTCSTSTSKQLLGPMHVLPGRLWLLYSGGPGGGRYKSPSRVVAGGGGMFDRAGPHQAPARINAPSVERAGDVSFWLTQP